MFYKVRQKSTGLFLKKEHYLGFHKTGHTWTDEIKLKLSLAHARLDETDTEIVTYEAVECRTTPITAHAYEGRKLQVLKRLEHDKKELARLKKAKASRLCSILDCDIERLENRINAIEEPEAH